MDKNNQRRTRNPIESWPQSCGRYHSFPNCSRLFRLSGNSVLRWQISGAFRRFQGGLRKHDEHGVSSPPRVGQDSKLKTQPANSFFEFFEKEMGPKHFPNMTTSGWVVSQQNTPRKHCASPKNSQTRRHFFEASIRPNLPNVALSPRIEIAGEKLLGGIILRV